MNRNLDAETSYNRALESYTSYQFDQSILFCKRTLTLKPNDYDAHFQWGSSQNCKEPTENLLRKHKEIICRNPKDSRAYHNLGLALDNQNKWLEAEIQYKKSLEIDPSDQGSLHNIAIILTKQRKYTEALEQFEKILLVTDHQDIASTYNCYGFLKFILGEYEKAIESFEEAIQKGSNFLSYFNKVLVLYCVGKPELALEVFQEIHEKFGGLQAWHPRLQKTLRIYTEELGSLKELSESDDLGEIKREKLTVNIKGLEYVADLLKQELSKPLVGGDHSG